MQQAGDESICYSGSLMKYSFDEAKQKKGVRLVEIDKAGKASVKNIYLPQGRDVRVIEGDFAEILENRVKYPASDDYICVKLNDARPILDLHRKLRQIYPNFMCVERPTVAAAENTARAGKNFKKMTELELFGGFFAAMTGNNLAADEAKIMAQELDKFYKAERGEK
jgi:exonuclease SbcD